MSNEKRMIDANALGIGRCSKDILPPDYCAGWNGVINLIEKAPTIDAVPVVRCRECKYHYWEQEPCHGKSVHYCKLPHMRGVEVFKEFFCYYGERKEG